MPCAVAVLDLVKYRASRYKLTLDASSSGAQRRANIGNIGAAMQGAPNEIKRRHIALFANCDPAYGAGVAKALKLEPGDDRLKGTNATIEPREKSTAS